MSSEKSLEELENNVERLINAVILLRCQVEELEEENALLKAEQHRWRHDLSNLVTQLEEQKEPVI